MTISRVLKTQRNRKAIFTLMMTSVLLIVFENSAECGPSDSDSGTATARIVKPLKVVEGEKLEFGEIYPNNDCKRKSRKSNKSRRSNKSDKGKCLGRSNGSVIITPPHSRSTTGGVRVKGDFEAAEFEIHGEPYRFYTVTISDQQIPNEDGPGSLTATDFQVLSKTLGAISPNGKLNGAGEDELKVGGTLVVPKNSSPGEYEGEIIIFISY